MSFLMEPHLPQPWVSLTFSAYCDASKMGKGIYLFLFCFLTCYFFFFKFPPCLFFSLSISFGSLSLAETLDHSLDCLIIGKKGYQRSRSFLFLCIPHPFLKNELRDISFLQIPSPIPSSWCPTSSQEKDLNFLVATQNIDDTWVSDFYANYYLPKRRNFQVKRKQLCNLGGVFQMNGGQWPA